MQSSPIQCQWPAVQKPLMWNLLLAHSRSLPGTMSSKIKSPHYLWPNDVISFQTNEIQAEIYTYRKLSKIFQKGPWPTPLPPSSSLKLLSCRVVRRFISYLSWCCNKILEKNGFRQALFQHTVQGCSPLRQMFVLSSFSLIHAVQNSRQWNAPAYS